MPKDQESSKKDFNEEVKPEKKYKFEVPLEERQGGPYTFEVPEDDIKPKPEQLKPF